VQVVFGKGTIFNALLDCLKRKCFARQKKKDKKYKGVYVVEASGSHFKHF